MTYQGIARDVIIIGAVLGAAIVVLTKWARREPHAPSVTGAFRHGYRLVRVHPILLWLPLLLSVVNWVPQELWGQVMTLRALAQVPEPPPATPVAERLSNWISRLVTHPEWAISGAIGGIDRAEAPIGLFLAIPLALGGAWYLGRRLVSYGEEQDSLPHRLCGWLAHLLVPAACVAGFGFLATVIGFPDVRVGVFMMLVEVPLGVMAEAVSRIAMLTLIYSMVAQDSSDWRACWNNVLRWLPAMLVWVLIIAAPTVLWWVGQLALWPMPKLFPSLEAFRVSDIVTRVPWLHAVLRAALLLVVFWVPFVIVRTGQGFRGALRTNFTIWAKMGAHGLCLIALAAAVMLGCHLVSGAVGALLPRWQPWWSALARATGFLGLVASAFLVPGIALFVERALTALNLPGASGETETPTTPTEEHI